METVGDLLKEDQGGTPVEKPDNPAGDVLEKRLSGEDSLLSLRRKRKIADWMEEAFGLEIVEPVRRMIRSVMEYEDTVVLSANSMGKAQPVDEPVLTPSGWRDIGKLRPGDQVFGRDGTPTTVLDVYPQGQRFTSRITFNDGASTRATDEHLWLTRTSTDKNKERGWQLRTTKNLASMPGSTIHVPLNEPIQWGKKELPVDPYVLGVLIGDGEIGTNVRFDTQDDEIVSVMSKLTGGQLEVSSYRGTHYGIIAEAGSRNPLKEKLSDLHLLGCRSHEKHIPRCYLRGSVRQRRKLLRGLMDSDGTPHSSFAAQFTSTSKRLAAQVQSLVRSLGGTASLACRDDITYDYNGSVEEGRDAWRVYLKTKECPFRLERKAEGWAGQRSDRQKPYRTIKNIEPLGSQEAVCVRVAESDSLYVTNDFVVTHNTHAAARLGVSLFRWLTEDPEVKDVEVFTSAAPPEDNLERLLWGEIYAALDEAENIDRGWKVNSMHIEAGPNSYITGVTIPRSERPEEMESRFSGKHADALFFIFDEGDAIPKPVYSGAQSCMSGGQITKMLTLLNPRSPSGPVYEKVRNGECNVVRMSAFDHPNVQTGEQKIPGAVTREKTVRRIAKWSRPLGENEEEPEDRVTFEVPDFLVGKSAERKDGGMAGPLPPGIRVTTNPSLCHMVLARYPKSSSYKLISKAWVEAAIKRWEEHVKEHGPEIPDGSIMGYDVASVGADKNVLCFRKGDFVGRFDCKWGGVDSDVGAANASSFFEQKNASKAKVDTTGVGDGVPRKMRRKGCARADGVKVSETPTTSADEGEFYQLRDQLYWKVREWLRPKNDEPSTAMLPPNEGLKRQLTTPTWTQTTSGEIRIMKKEKMVKELQTGSPDELDALALTFAPENPWTETARWGDDDFEPQL